MKRPRALACQTDDFRDVGVKKLIHINKKFNLLFIFIVTYPYCGASFSTCT